MSTVSNKALIESFVEEVLNKHDLSAIDKYSSPIEAKGGGSFKQFLCEFFTAFTGIGHRLSRILESIRFTRLTSPLWRLMDVPRCNSKLYSYDHNFDILPCVLNCGGLCFCPHIYYDQLL
jgi:hypothetical protein